jgi:hypothetical protein
MNLIQGQILTVNNKRFQVDEIWMKSVSEVDYYSLISLDGSGKYKMTWQEIQERIPLITSWTLSK